MIYSIWEYQDIVCAFAGLIVVRGHQWPTLLNPLEVHGALMHLVWALCIDYNNTTTFSPPSTDLADIEADALLSSYEAFFNCCQWYYSCDYRCTLIFHLSKDWSAWAWNKNLCCQGCSSSPTNVFLSLLINCSMKRELSMFWSAQQNESSQVKEHLAAWMDCNWFLFWVQLASEPSAGESCLHKLSNSCNLYH